MWKFWYVQAIENNRKSLVSASSLWYPYVFFLVFQCLGIGLCRRTVISVSRRGSKMRKLIRNFKVDEAFLEYNLRDFQGTPGTY